MNYKEYLKTTSGVVKLPELIDYFIPHFFDIRKEDVAQHFDSKILDITNTPAVQLMRTMERAQSAELGAYFSEDFQAFTFRDDDGDNIPGRLNIDFIDGTLVNVEIYLYTTGFFASWRNDKKYEFISKALKERFGQPDEALKITYANFAPDWHLLHRAFWKFSKLVISFSKTPINIPGLKKANPGVSLTITKEELMIP